MQLKYDIAVFFDTDGTDFTDDTDYSMKFASRHHKFLVNSQNFMFKDGEHKFTVHEHMFKGDEHKFTVREHKIYVRMAPFIPKASENNEMPKK